MFGVLQYPLTLGTQPLTNYIKFSEYRRQKRTASILTKQINLYVPDEVVNPGTVSWDTGQLGTMGGFIQNVATSGSIGGAKQHVMDHIKEVRIGMLGVHAAGLAANFIGSSISGEQAFGHIFKRVPNPYLTMLFRGVDFREFSFTFSFYPHSKSEANAIHEIVKSFRAAAYPAKWRESDEPYFLEYPSEFEIEYRFVDSLFIDSTNKYMNKFKRCVITSVNQNNAGGGGFSTTRDGFPSVIELSLGFSEIDIILRDDIESGGY